MGFIIIYKGDFSFIEKNSLEDAFSLPGDYYVFEEASMIQQYGRFYKDPFIYYKSKEQFVNLRINDLELIDTKITFTYNSNFSIEFSLYDFVTSKTYKILKSGPNHTKAFPIVMSFLVETMTKHPISRDWRFYELEQENIKLRAELEELRKKMTS
ncbi:hypothetical protein [Aquirufa echingensis]|uniref:Uncharacterized protein n=1 Tax=Aquirufa echingensis TaxID=3096516 RepID=A0ABW6D2A2_9BACT